MKFQDQAHGGPQKSYNNDMTSDGLRIDDDKW